VTNQRFLAGEKMKWLTVCAAAILASVAANLEAVQIPSIGVTQNISIGSNCWLDAYNCAAGEKLIVQTNSTAAHAINIGRSIIDGDVVVGAGGNPAQIISNPSSVTGAMYATPQNLVYPSVMVPQNLAYSASKGSISGTITISGSGKYDGISLSGGILTINAPVSLYITGDISLDTGQIQITPNGALTLYVGGDITGNNGISINTLGQDPKKLTILGLNACTTISWQDSGNFYGTIYAPAADFSARNGNSIYGTVISNSFSFGNNDSFHYAGSLPEPATIGLLALGGLMLRKRKI
jgi:hypothetical protein